MAALRERRSSTAGTDLALIQYPDLPLADRRTAWLAVEKATS